MHVEDGDTYVQDVIHHVELMKNKYPHLPCILMGHSMVYTCTYMFQFPVCNLQCACVHFYKYFFLTTLQRLTFLLYSTNGMYILV